MADWHKIRIRTAGGQWVTEEIPAGSSREAKETAAARWPHAKAVEWQGTCQSPEAKAASAAFRADTERKTQEYYRAAHGHVPGGRPIGGVDHSSYQPHNGGSGGSGGGYSAPEGGSGCAAIAVIFGGLAALSVAGAAFHAVTAPLRWVGIMEEPTASAPYTHSQSRRVTGAQPVDLSIQRQACIAAFDNGGPGVVSAIEAKFGYDCEYAMAAGH